MDKKRVVTLSIYLIILLCLPTACTNNQISEELKSANAYFEAGDYNSALKEYQKLIESDSNHKTDEIDKRIKIIQNYLALEEAFNEGDLLLFKKISPKDNSSYKDYLALSKDYEKLFDNYNSYNKIMEQYEEIEESIAYDLEKANKQFKELEPSFKGLPEKPWLTNIRNLVEEKISEKEIELKEANSLDKSVSNEENFDDFDPFDGEPASPEHAIDLVRSTYYEGTSSDDVSISYSGDVIHKKTNEIWYMIDTANQTGSAGISTFLVNPKTFEIVSYETYYDLFVQ